MKGTCLLLGALVPALVVAQALRIERLAPDTVRVRLARDGKWPESGLNRYGIIAALPVQGEETSLPLAGLELKHVGKGFEISLPLAADESVYGLGDIDRTKLNRRGGSYELWVRNVVGYTPVPLAISSKGYGVLVNTTWRHVADVGKTDPDRLVFSAQEGEADVYVFTGGSPREVLDAYTRLTGRPSILPIWGYGLAYVCFDRTDEFQLLNYATEFRRGNFPCDTLGLDPGWMSRNYDFSVRKGWHPDRFYELWPYLTRRETFIGTLDRMGYKLNLWLCCDYDHFEHEEAALAGRVRKHEKIVTKASGGITEGWVDWHMSDDPGLKAAQEKDHATNGLSLAEQKGLYGREPWFEHLREFVGQGVQGFKLDGANQVVDHPDRVWRNGMTDAEAHNLYPLVYAKEMVRSHELATGLRPMTYTDCGWAGFQQFSATWTGDTGGGAGPLAAMLQQGVVGHSNSSCDLVTTDVRALHFGFLSPWTLLDDWAFFFQPWCQEKDRQDVFRAYDELHYRLLPYIYSAAHAAHLTGWPVMRTLALEYPEAHPAYDACLTTWKFGDSLLVSAFADETPVPAGDWYDWRTGEKVTGPAKVAVPVTPDWGGALYVKAGAIVPMWPVKQHVDKGWNEQVEFHVWPQADGTAELYEDDGVTLGYRDGRGAVTPLAVRTEKGFLFDTTTLEIGPRTGSFEGQSAACDVTVVWHDGATAETNHVGTVDFGRRTVVAR